MMNEEIKKFLAPSNMETIQLKEGVDPLLIELIQKTQSVMLNALVEEGDNQGVVELAMAMLYNIQRFVIYNNLFEEE